MSGLRLWYEGDRQVLGLGQVVTLYQPECDPQPRSLCHFTDVTRPDNARYERRKDAQSTRGVQLYGFGNSFLDYK